jgi:hypothetical protein
MSSHHDTHRRSRHRDSSERSASPRRHHRDSDRSRSRSHKKRVRCASPARLPLPLNASQISTRDYDFLLPIFASYLTIQKNLSLSSLDTREAKGRFKSFVSH